MEKKELPMFTLNVDWSKWEVISFIGSNFKGCFKPQKQYIDSWRALTKATKTIRALIHLCACETIEHNTTTSSRNRWISSGCIQNLGWHGRLLPLWILRCPRHLMWWPRSSLLWGLLHTRLHRLHFRERPILLLRMHTTIILLTPKKHANLHRLVLVI